MPVYDIAHDGRTGWQTLDLDGSPHFLAEGVFAQQVVPVIRERGGWRRRTACVSITLVTFWRPLTRDLRERRRLVRRAEALDCRAATPEQVYHEIRALL